MKEISANAEAKRIAKRAGISRLNAQEVMETIKRNHGLVCYSAEKLNVTYRTLLKALMILHIDPETYRGFDHNRVSKFDREYGYDYQKDVIQNARITACKQCRKQITDALAVEMCNPCPNKAEGWND